VPSRPCRSSPRACHPTCRRLARRALLATSATSTQPSDVVWHVSNGRGTLARASPSRQVSGIATSGPFKGRRDPKGGRDASTTLIATSKGSSGRVVSQSARFRCPTTSDKLRNHFAANGVGSNWPDSAIAFSREMSAPWVKLPGQICFPKSPRPCPADFARPGDGGRAWTPALALLN
jgi:hypothetical protein